MEKKYLNIVKYFVLFFILGLNLIMIQKVNNLSTEVVRIEKQIDTIYLNSPLERIITLTVYNPVESQCDDTPLVTANGTKIDLEKLKKGEIKYCAVSRDLLSEIPYDSIIYIEGHGEYEVVDTINKRIKMGIH